MGKEDEDLDGMKGAVLALTGVAAGLIKEATGSKRAGRVLARIERRFGIDDEHRKDGK